jgi:hypothetical protein
MLAAQRVAILGTAVLAAIVLAATSRAENQQYQGSLVIESFGNDVVGAMTPFSVFGMPQGIQCNPNQPRCNLASTPVATTMMGAKVFNPLGNVCVPIGYFGVTMRPAKGATATTGKAATSTTGSRASSRRGEPRTRPPARRPPP